VVGVRSFSLRKPHPLARGCLQRQGEWWPDRRSIPGRTLAQKQTKIVAARCQEFIVLRPTWYL
jgi:hypothetical protein